MPWNSTFPLGSVSVKANRTIGNQNTTYTEVTMGNSIVGTNTNTVRDHFWAVGSNEDGRHRFIQSVGFTSTAVAPNDFYPVLGAGMQTVIFPILSKGQVVWYHKNQDNNDRIYQFIPNFLQGTVTINSSSSYVTIDAVPNNVYGEIFMWNDDNGSNTGQTAFFKSKSSVVDTWAIEFRVQGSSSSYSALKFGNGSEASGLDIRVRRDESSKTSWNYRITYRAINI